MCCRCKCRSMFPIQRVCIATVCREGSRNTRNGGLIGQVIVAVRVTRSGIPRMRVVCGCIAAVRMVRGSETSVRVVLGSIVSMRMSRRCELRSMFSIYCVGVTTVRRKRRRDGGNRWFIRQVVVTVTVIRRRVTRVSMVSVSFARFQCLNVTFDGIKVISQATVSARISPDFVRRVSRGEVGIRHTVYLHRRSKRKHTKRTE